MGRQAKGCVAWDPRKSAWTVRVTLRGGKQTKPIDMSGRNLLPCAIAPTSPEKNCGCVPCVAARADGQLVSKRMRDGGAVEASTTLTVSEWYEDYYEAAEKGAVGRKNRGKPQASVEDRRARFRRWVEPVIGTLGMSAVTAADLRRVVAKLDEAIRERAVFYDNEEPGEERTGRKPGLSAKTAQNVWSEVTNGFREAVSSKLDKLRVLTANPATTDVQGPATSDHREQAALFPSEVVKLLACEAVPLHRRRCYAAAIYTGMRRSELERLDAADVDLDHDVIRVRGTKTTAAKRTIPIEPSLRPLLEVLLECPKCSPAGGECDSCGGKGKRIGTLLEVPRADGKGGASDLTKKDLERAGLDRPDLTRDDAENMPFTFHGLRHTCITHWTVAGRDQLFLLTAGGHTDVAMTKRYLAAASSLSAKFGIPHPPIPPQILYPDADESNQYDSSKSVDDPQKQSGEPEGFPAVLTSPWRPQRESKAASDSTSTASRASKKSEPIETSAKADSTVPAPALAADSPSELDPDAALVAAIKAALDAGDEVLEDQLRAILRARRKAAVTPLRVVK